MAYGVIMAGGSGTRFWPKSRRRRPKQLLKLADDRTMLQLAADRLAGVIEPQDLFVITSAALAAEAKAQLPQVPEANVIGEPMGRDTAACIGLGALLARRRDPQAIMVVTTADHLIRAAEQFRCCLRAAIEEAQEPGVLVTFGVKPTGPATTFGYVRRGARRGEKPGLGAPIRVYDVREFREKPCRELALEYVASGEYYWNSGMFVWRADTILDNLAQSTPKLHAALTELEPKLGSPNQDAAIAEAYKRVDKISIDYAVMEAARNVRVVEATFDWDDVGSWLALERLHEQDASGNTRLAELLAVMDARGCVLESEPGHLLAVIGVENCVIVHTRDATLVCAKDRVDDIKKLVQELDASGERYQAFL